MDKLIISNNHTTYRRVIFTYRNGNQPGYKQMSFKIDSTMQNEDFSQEILTDYYKKIELELKDSNAYHGEIQLLNFRIEICAEIHGVLNVVEMVHPRSEPVTIEQVVYKFDDVTISNRSLLESMSK